MACRVARAREWSTRIMHEMGSWDDSVFATLTYDQDHLPPDGSISKDELQRFFKRLRKALGDRKIRYYACGEYGEKFNRPHYHAILFGVGFMDKPILDKAWGLGFIKLGTVTYDSARYVADYIIKGLNGPKAKEVYGDKQIPFRLLSKGMGKEFAEQNAKQIADTLQITIHGAQVGIPRYYRKIVGITTEMLAEKAAEADDKVRQYHESKGAWTDRDQVEALFKARRQAEKNLIARKNLTKKGVF